MFSVRSAAGVLLTLTMAATPVLAQDALEKPKVQHQNDVAYVSGGISKEEQQALQAMSGDYSLMVTFAIPEGNYISGGKMKIEDDQGGTILDIETKGPIFYANLQPGMYTITAEPLDYDEQRAQRKVEIGEGQASVHFTWDI